MKRRQFLGILGGAAVAWPKGVVAQQANKPRLVGVLGFASNDPKAQNRFMAFRDAFQGFGWIEGRNVRIEVRWAGATRERLKDDAAELVAFTPDVILCGLVSPVELSRKPCPMEK